MNWAHLSQDCEILRQLHCKDIEWSWLPNDQKAFEKKKMKLTEALMLSYYDPNRELTIECDASQHGLGAALMQGGQPVAYASRALSEAESRYTQNVRVRPTSDNRHRPQAFGNHLEKAHPPWPQTITTHIAAVTEVCRRHSLKEKFRTLPCGHTIASVSRGDGRTVPLLPHLDRYRSEAEYWSWRCSPGGNQNRNLPRLYHTRSQERCHDRMAFFTRGNPQIRPAVLRMSGGLKALWWFCYGKWSGRCSRAASGGNTRESTRYIPCGDRGMPASSETYLLLAGNGERNTWLCDAMRCLSAKQTF